ncbi:MAG TPA: CRTAC1 family protein [Vicinamibacteria bacterium]|nr:CRTAC1 family protein [Vicinamibacteria bacterium]
MSHLLRSRVTLGLLALLEAAPSLSAPPAPPSPFVLANEAEARGVRFLEKNFATDMKYPFETLGGAVAALDYDRDGFVDLLFLNGAASPEHLRADPASFNRLFRNTGDGRFVDVTDESGLSGAGIKGYPQGVAVGDYDNDGYPDVLVTNYGDNVLYHNDANGHFTDVTARAGVAMPSHPLKASAAFFDYDNDGWLDLFVTHYFQWTFAEDKDVWCGRQQGGHRIYCDPDVFKPLPNVLLRNRGDGTFADVSEQVGLNQYLGKGMGVTVADYDGDGRMDVFVTNDRMPHFLYKNGADGRFREVAFEAGVAANESGVMVSGMGCDFEDFDDDGWPDIFLSDLVRDVFTLFVNQGKGFFVDRTFPSGVASASMGHSGWSVKMLDVDNDGRKDVFVAGSHVVDNVELYSPAARYKEGCFLFRNVGEGRIEDLSDRVGPDLRVAGAWRGLAAADVDNDGTLEVAVSQLNGPAALFVKKGGAANNWLLLDLEGTRSNRDAIGARVRQVLPSGRTLHAHVTTANGIYSASDKRVHFGLGTETGIAHLEIAWPSGAVQRVERPGINQVLHVVEAAR